MLLFGPYLIETILWVFSTTVIAAWVTRTYIHSFIALGLGRMKKPAAKTRPDKAPFVTVMLATYNEASVVDRLLGAVTKIDYPNFEVIVADDSTDKSTLERLRPWQEKHGIKVVHRESRSGFKAGALNNALRHANSKCEYLALFDADYVPGKDILWEMVGDFCRDDIAAVQGYTKHTLNAAQNYITRSVSLSFSAYCLEDMPARALLGGFIPIFGSVFMLRKFALESVGGFNGHSITEDYDLASKLVARGYSVLYDENISAPAECPSTMHAFLRQQMRWAEGQVRDTRNNIVAVLRSKANFMKKFDYAFYGFGSLNGILGVISYVLTGITFLINQRILITLGVDRSLIMGLGAYGTFLLLVAPIYIPVALLFAAFVGLYRERRLANLRWFPYLFVVSLVLSPFLAYGGLKGLLFSRGSWARTPKTGEITKAA